MAGVTVPYRTFGFANREPNHSSDRSLSHVAQSATFASSVHNSISPKSPYIVAYITINALVASDPRPEGSKLLAAVGKFVGQDLKVVLATGNESQNSILKSSKICVGIFLL